MAKWLVANKGADFAAIASACGISPITARIIRNRGVLGEEATRQYLNGKLNDLHSPMLLHDMDLACRILHEKIDRSSRIRIIGDYDVDGICSSYILLRMLTFLGGLADVRLPDRVADGYGINIRLVEEAHRDGIDTILTCDNGIAAAIPLARAKELGITVIVTDHHEIPFSLDPNGGAHKKIYQLPPADAVIEPKLVEQETGNTYYPFTEICGAAVAFKLAQAMLGLPDLGENSFDTPVKELLKDLLAFAGIATVCDVMPLQDENRILVRYGLAEAQRTRNTGLMSLITASGLKDKALTCYHAGFVIGPCLNATGRLDSAERALALFSEENSAAAMQMAAELKVLNDNRKSMTEKGVEDALAMVEDPVTGLLGDTVFVLYLPSLHESLAGIVAGRVKERYFRPTFVLTGSAEDPELLKGSGRSIEDYDMYGHMNEVSGLFVKFGGHKMAAGLTIRKEELEELRRRLNEKSNLRPEQLQDTLHIDMELPMQYVTEALIREFSLLEPCGTANPRPVFVMRNLELTLSAVLGKNRNVLKFTGRDEQGRIYDLIRFDQPDDARVFHDRRGHRCHVVYYPDINEFRGRRSVQFVIKDWRIVDP